ncbi:hypothetical protein F5Y15DRAFT_332286 [Xylariaceae sp. FL0016]|nr:hypothetical protein F5Y15DRAFT_332286 [Xylariaceae sp. FL0016]
MADTPDATMTDATTLSTAIPKASKSHELVTATIKSPPYSYAHLQVFNPSPASGRTFDLDALQLRSWCTAAMKQFLGVTGTGVSLDVLKVGGSSAWVRLPRNDLAAFAAAVTAWQGAMQDGEHYSLRVKGCSDWLGALVGQEGQDELWTS